MSHSLEIYVIWPRDACHMVQRCMSHGLVLKMHVTWSRCMSHGLETPVTWSKCMSHGLEMYVTCMSHGLEMYITWSRDACHMV